MSQATFRALGDPTRRAILTMLIHRDMTIADVSDQFDMTRAAVKKHLVVLEQGNLISVEARGRERVNRLNAQGFAPVRDWLGFFDQFWDDRLTTLKDVFEKEDQQ